MANRRKTILASLAAFIVVAIPCTAIALLELTWFGPARIYADAQSRCEAVFADKDWTGHPLWFHYDHRVRFVCAELDDDSVSSLYPIIHSVKGLRYIELYATSLTPGGVAAMKKEFPDCYFTVYDQSF